MLPTCSMSNVENLSPQTIRRLAKELESLSSEPPEGIKVLCNHDDVTDIQALIDGPAGTPYSGGVFKVKIVLGKDFPVSPPKAFFVTSIFHPNVAKSGEICVNTLKRDWNSDLGIKHILLTIKCLLIVPNAESALNEEAGKMLLERYEEYSQRAKLMTDIHATNKRGKKEESKGAGEEPQVKKHATDRKASSGSSTMDPKKKLLKDKKRTLKRL